MSIKDVRTSQTETTTTNTTTIIQSIPREQPNKTCSTCDGTKSGHNSSNDRGRKWINRPKSNTLSKRTHWRLGKHQPGNTKIIPTSKKYHRKQTQNVEIWIQSTCNNSEKIEWLADTGSRRSFINQSTAKKLMSNNPNIKIERYNEYKRYRCFNNKEIKIKGVIHMDITSGNWIVKKCQILIVEQNTTNLMGRDMLPKLGISLQQTKQQGRQIHHISDIQTKKTLPNGYSKNIHTYVQV